RGEQCVERGVEPCTHPAFWTLWRGAGHGDLQLHDLVYADRRNVEDRTSYDAFTAVRVDAYRRRTAPRDGDGRVYRRGASRGLVDAGRQRICTGWCVYRPCDRALHRGVVSAAGWLT